MNIIVRMYIHYFRVVGNYFQLVWSKFELQIRGERLHRVDSYDRIRTYTRSTVYEF